MRNLTDVTVTSVNLKKAGMASRNIVIKNNTRCFKSALLLSSDFSFLFLYILAYLISFLEIQRLLAGSSSTVFVVNLILYFCNLTVRDLCRGLYFFDK